APSDSPRARPVASLETSLRARRRGGGAGDAQQLDVEHERTGGGSGARGLVAVSEITGDPEAGFLADFHELDALSPALDDLAEREADGLTAHHGAVEQLSVGGPAAVVHLDGVRRLRVLSAPDLEHAVGEPARRLLRGFGRGG